MAAEVRVPSSFRDPSGFLFTRAGILYRQVNRPYQPHYEALLSSGLYARLIADALLIPHREVDVPAALPGISYKVLQPEPVRFISYPYEWCFSQLKEAALTTLRIQKIALEHGLSLKDASAYNIQFHQGRPLLIDTLSFARYQEGEPWVAYRQFCQHFLAPLALMARVDVRLNQLLRVHLDGVPLDLASALLQGRTRFSALQLHIHLHARAQARYAQQQVKPVEAHMTRFRLLALLDSLESEVRKLRWKPVGTEWADYETEHSYTPAGVESKQRTVTEYLRQAAPQVVWDLGANTGRYSRLAAARAFTVAFDVDPAAVERNYQQVTKERETSLLPLVLDLTNPSAGLGWSHKERMSLLQRGPVDLVLALALLHHLAISNNVPFAEIAAFLRRSCTWLVIEFVPKDDPQVQRLLVTREDIFTDYTRQVFEKEFGRYFDVIAATPIQDSARVLYLMHARGPA